MAPGSSLPDPILSVYTFLVQPHNPMSTESDMTGPSATSDSTRIGFVLLGWPLSVAVGWLLGDWDRLIFNESWRSMPYPLNLPSPAFVFITLTLAIYLGGAASYLGDSQSRRRGFWILSISALCGGIFTFLTAAAVTVVLRSV